MRDKGLNRPLHQPSGWRPRLAATTALVVLMLGFVAAQDQPPRFQSSVDVTSVDCTVVNSDGTPVLNLTPADFTVRVDGSSRRVLKADWISLSAAPADRRRSPEGYTTNETAAGGRLILIVIDRPNMRFGGFNFAREALDRFIDDLPPSDSVGVVGLGAGAPAVSFTTDHARVKRAMVTMAGQRDMLPVDMMNVLRNMLNGLIPIEGPKTVLLVSEGIVIPKTELAIVPELGRLAAAGRTTIYALRLDQQVADADQQASNNDPASSNPASGGASAQNGGFRQNLPDLPFPTGPAGARAPDRMLSGDGLSMIAAATGGPMFTAAIAANVALARIETELSGYYLLAVESAPLKSDGQTHKLDVRVAKSGVTVRAQRELAVRKAPAQNLSPDQRLLPAFNSPVMASALPLRVTTLSRRDPGKADVQLLIHAEIGNGYTALKTVTVGYLITDAQGRVVKQMAGVSPLHPLSEAAPSPLQLTTSVTIAPGEYTLKLAVADEDRLGSIARAFQAGPTQSGSFSLSDLFVGGPETAAAGALTVGSRVMHGFLQGYVEVDGTDVRFLHVTYEIAATPDGPALAADEVAPKLTNGRAVYNHVMPLRSVPAGAYTLRVRISSPGGPLKTLTRGFEIPPSVP